jgi:cell division protein FtsQ
MRSLSAWRKPSLAEPLDVAVAYSGAVVEAKKSRTFDWTTLPAPPRGLGGALAVTLLVVATAAGFVSGGHYRTLVAGAGGLGNLVAKAAGLGVERVVINGLSELGGRDALISAGVGKDATLPFFDVDVARAKLEALPLVQQASVRKFYPNEIVIDIVERSPTAIWQKDGDLHTIAADGAIIDELKNPRFADLPFVVGAGANKRLDEYQAISTALEELKSKVAAGVLVDERRWRLKFTSGMLVDLPEIAPEAAAAELVRLQREHRILDRDLVSIDLRTPDRVFVRLSEGASLPDRDPKPKKGGPT